MTTAKVMKLFLLFSGAARDADWHEIIEEAIGMTRASLKDGADETDYRLDYYAAALANLRYRQILASRTSVSPTYAGTVQDSKQNGGAGCTYAAQLLAQYRKDCAGLLRQESDAMLINIGKRGCGNGSTDGS